MLAMICYIVCSFVLIPINRTYNTITCQSAASRIDAEKNTFMADTLIRYDTMSFPKVSIVTPSFNQAQFIEKTILSVIGQDYPNIEYIVIDGGSTDGSQEIIRKYEDKITYWVSERDNGQSDAINKGFRKCTGEIVAWINSDDLYADDGAVSRIVRFFSEHHDVDMVHGDVDFIDENGKILYNIKSRDFTLQELLETNRVSQPATFWKRKIFEEVGYLNEARHYIMDYDFWVRVALKYNIRHIDATIARFRLHGQSKTMSWNDLFLVENLIMLEDLLKRRPVPEETERGVFVGMQSLLSKFDFTNLAAMENHLRRYDPATVTKIRELAEYRATLLNRNIGLSGVKAVKAHLHDYFLSYFSRYENHQRYVTDRFIDTIVADEMFNITYYLFASRQRGKSMRLFLMLVCTNSSKLKKDYFKTYAKKVYHWLKH
jgi:Glycosyltransferases involved in cell wall biogenesis